MSGIFPGDLLIRYTGRPGALRKYTYALKVWIFAFGARPLWRFSG